MRGSLMTDLSTTASIDVNPRRGSRDYVANPTPHFVVPGHHKGRPRFIQASLNILNARHVAYWAGWTPICRAIGRTRHFNPHRARAMQAMAVAMTTYVNLVTWQVETSVDVLTRQCSLDTTSAKGNHSITRGSRVIQLFEKAGLVVCESHWDPVAGCWAFKSVQVTERFWDMIGIGAERAVRERELTFERWRNNESKTEGGISLAALGRMSISEYSRLRKLRIAQRAFEYRRKKSISAKEILRAKRLVSLGKDAMRRQIADDLFSKLTPDEARRTMHDPAAFNRTVTLEMSRISARAIEPVPS